MRTFYEKLHFPEEAIIALCDAQKKMSVDFKSQYELFINSSHEEAINQINDISKKSGVFEETANMVFLLSCLPYAKELYLKKGISDEIFYETFSDLKCKLLECYNTNGVWGTFVPAWYTRHFKAELFALGRLQFEKIRFDYNYTDNNLKKGDYILNCHIPSSGPLTPESVQESLKKAYEFYNCTGTMYVMCHSWLLYPPYYDLFGKNTKAFCDLFEIFEYEESNIELWRIFNKWNFEDIQENDLKTSLQKNFYSYLKQGKATGFGIGIIKFQP